MKHTCPVCGFQKLVEAPRGKSGGGSYEICPSCGFQFGVSDDDAGFSYAQWRARWRKGGSRWAGTAPAPENWDAAAQFQQFSARLAHEKSAATNPPQ